MIERILGRPDATLGGVPQLLVPHRRPRDRDDADGFFYYVDRSPTRSAGAARTSPPSSSRRVVSAHPDVLECAAYGVPSELGEDEVMVAVVRRGDLDVEALIAHCEDRS